MEDYDPIDTQNIKQSKIKSEKELEKDINEIAIILKDTQTSDWKDRIKAMENIQSIVLTERCTSMANFPKLMEKLVKPLINQLMDLRSRITKEASTSVRIIVQELENEFNYLSHKFIDSNGLFKLLSSATKITADHGHL
jgi:phenylpyruvate tautomerase PptA (4-oxalocrotonate tautomerase family)